VETSQKGKLHTRKEYEMRERSLIQKKIRGENAYKDGNRCREKEWGFIFNI
jgi:hypothetical protein